MQWQKTGNQLFHFRPPDNIAMSVFRGLPVIVVSKAVSSRIDGMSTVTDHLRKKIGVVIDLMRHIASDVQKDLEKFGTAVHVSVVGGRWSVVSVSGQCQLVSSRSRSLKPSIDDTDGQITN